MLHATQFTAQESKEIAGVLQQVVLSAEQFFPEAGVQQAPAVVGPGGLRASAGDMSSWAARTYGMKGTRLVDHSGLGDSSRMRPDDLVTALVKVRQRGILRPLLKPISVRDTKGRVVKGHPIKVNAKTGTLNFVSGLGGFMTAADGTEMAFAILTADTQTRARVKRADREIPQGAREWNRRSKRLQNTLIVRWGALYGS